MRMPHNNLFLWLTLICYSGVIAGVDYSANDHVEKKVPSVAKYATVQWEPFQFCQGSVLTLFLFDI